MRHRGIERDIALAYHTAAFQRAKRLKPLKTYLKPAKTRVLSEEEAQAKQREMQELMKRMGVDE